jgi:hypothetical protein
MVLVAMAEEMACKMDNGQTFSKGGASFFDNGARMLCRFEVLQCFQQSNLAVGLSYGRFLGVSAETKTRKNSYRVVWANDRLETC